MVSSWFVLWISVCVFAGLGTLSALVVGWKMLYYIDPWWDWSLGDAQAIHNATYYFTLSPIVAFLGCGAIWFFFGEGKSGVFATMARTILFVVLGVQFYFSTRLAATATYRGMENAQKNYSKRLFVWTLSQIQQEINYYSNKTKDMTLEAGIEWKKEYDNSKENYYYAFPGRIMIIYMVQVIAMLGTVFYFSHLMCLK